MTKNRNPFLTSDRAKLCGILAENFTKLLGNNITSAALHAGRVGADDLLVNLHMVDRVGAMLNALCALGYSWDGVRFHNEIVKARAAGTNR